jgi:hypothetical protein
MPCRLTLVPLAVACLATNVVAAASPQDTTLVGAQVEVHIQHGMKGPSSKLKGHLVAVTRDSAVLRQAGENRTVPLVDVSDYKVRTMVRQTAEGSVLGLGLGFAIAGNSENSAAISLGTAAAGAALGWLIKLPEYKRVPVSRIRPDPIPGTVVRVERASGRIDGILVEASPEQIVIEIPEGIRIPTPRHEVTAIAWRSGKKPPSVIPPILLGAVGVVVGLAAFPEDADCQEGDWCEWDQGMGKLGYGFVGLGIGAAVGGGVSLAAGRPWAWEKAPAPAPRIMLRPGPDGRFVVGLSQAVRF